MASILGQVIASDIDPVAGPDLDQVKSFVEPMLYYIFGLSLFVISIMMFWQGSIGLTYNEKLPEEYRKSTTFFKIALAYPFIHLPLFIIGWYEGFQGNFHPIVFVFLFISHFFMIFCVMYTHYFAAKTLKSFQLKREATTSDFIGYFFLFMFNFIGVWIIQPGVNETYLDTAETVE